VIAQQVEGILPELVSTDSLGFKSVKYQNLVAPLIESVKELNTQNQELKQRVEQLEDENSNLNRRLSSIEGAIGSH
jgi:predicted RNase H-like nuclease (RuvC/YqgF family)